jgi:hypothetical protein
VFEGTFTPAQGADALSSAVFLKGAPTPLTIRFSNAGGVPEAPDTHASVGGIRGMAIKFRLADGGENDCNQPMVPKERNSITGRLVDIRYVCSTCGMETRRTGSGETTRG